MKNNNNKYFYKKITSLKNIRVNQNKSRFVVIIIVNKSVRKKKYSAKYVFY